MSDTGHWIAQGLDLDPAGAIGFVYLIVDLETKQKYIGKKNFKGRGKANKGKQSNWKEYCSSSKAVQALIAEKGKDKSVTSTKSLPSPQAIRIKSSCFSTT